ncbi:MAG: hypothetical protein ACRES9_01760 [Gammaproteobacteria bacterium]
MVFLPFPARAAPPPPVAAALATLKQGGQKLANGWRYEEKITTNKGSERLSYDSSSKAGARWQVLDVNGKPPSSAARKRVAADAAKEARKNGGGLVVGAGWLAASDYQLVKSTPKTLVYRLSPKPGTKTDTTAAHLLDHLAGQFIVARDDYRPLSLSLSNFESFSPRFGIKIEAFLFRAEFKRLGTTGKGPVVVVRTSNSASGKVFWIKGFKDKTEVDLSHFAPVVTPAPGAQTGG